MQPIFQTLFQTFGTPFPNFPNNYRSTYYHLQQFIVPLQRINIQLHITNYDWIHRLICVSCAGLTAHKRQKHPTFLFPGQLYFDIKVNISVFEFIYMIYKDNVNRIRKASFYLPTYPVVASLLSVIFFFFPLLHSLTCVTFYLFFQSSWIPVGWRFT